MNKQLLVGGMWKESATPHVKVCLEICLEFFSKTTEYINQRTAPLNLLQSGKTRRMRKIVNRKEF